MSNKISKISKIKVIPTIIVNPLDVSNKLSPISKFRKRVNKNAIISEENMKTLHITIRVE